MEEYTALSTFIIVFVIATFGLSHQQLVIKRLCKACVLSLDASRLLYGQGFPGNQTISVTNYIEVHPRYHPEIGNPPNQGSSSSDTSSELSDSTETERHVMYRGGGWWSEVSLLDFMSGRFA